MKSVNARAIATRLALKEEAAFLLEQNNFVAHQAIMEYLGAADDDSLVHFHSLIMNYTLLRGDD
jgi:hypothetical protein